MVRIKAIQDGFRRAGISHTKEATEYPDSAFTAKELKALQAEPMLLVEVVADKEEKKKDEKK